jgi:putative ABC transport system permease protein
MEEIQEMELKRVQSIKNARNIAALGPLVLGVIQVNGHRVLMAGVDFKVSGILKPWWRINGALPDANGVLLGTEAARVLNLKPGDGLTVGRKGLTVTGIIEPTGSQDDQLAFARLATAQALFNKSGRVSMAEVAALCKDCPIDEMVRQISDALPGAKVMAIQQVVKGRMETLSQFKKFSFGISGVIMLIGSLVVLVTMMGSVRERTDEIGIFRAIGFRRGHVMQIIFLEAGIVSGLAGIIGYLLGWGAAKAAIGFFSAYPALMAARLDPNEALRAL